MIFLSLALSLASLLLSPAVSLFFFLLFLFSVYFFRNPGREIPIDADAIISPADGRVIAVEDVEDRRYLKRPSRRVSIFMSPFNVHVNRMPCDAEVTRAIRTPGRKFAAFAEKASLENEQVAVELLRPNGHALVCVQIAGFLARRIVCDARKGDLFKKGERYGLIRFGSRADLYLPLHYAVEVKVGDKVEAGSTIIARG